jgi:hypothetical protein
MTAELAHCRECVERWATPEHLDRCADRRKVLDALVTEAGTLDRPAGKRYVLDLANFLSRDGDYKTGAKAALTVLQLGWRPVVGLPSTP